MSKQITPEELAEIITGLLVKPEILGEDPTPDKFKDFMQQLGEVVADYFGGHINGVHFQPAPGEAPLMSVSPNSDLPSLGSNVWSNHDVDGWTEEEEGMDVSNAASFEETEKVRSQLQRLLIVDEPKVLVVVNGGVADPVYDDGLDVVVFDRDNYNADPEATGPVPARFADLAKGLDIPVEGDEPSVNSFESGPGM
jgi:hypothetical protein